jgi:hypothetical protein
MTPLDLTALGNVQFVHVGDNDLIIQIKLRNAIVLGPNDFFFIKSADNQALLVADGTFTLQLGCDAISSSEVV